MLLPRIFELAPIVALVTPAAPAPAPVDQTGTPSAPAAETAPAPDQPSVQSIRRVPIAGWTDIDARCRILTTFQSSSNGCAVGLRIGDVAYFHLSGGFFQTPEFERYMRYTRDGTPAASVPRVTILDPTRNNVFYVDLGPGVAMWPTRQLQIHLEGGAMAGIVHSVSTLALPTNDKDHVAFGAFAGVGLNYRIPSWPWALGFDYRVQGIPYGGLSSGEQVTESKVEVGQSLFGLVHSFGLSAIFRIEHDGTN